MVVLDADSLMAGETLVKMARLMELNPRVGILQAPLRCVGQTTLFARLQQFAGRVYGPVVAAGAVAWQLGESNSWGHNAILRVSAFTEHCGLPVLPGQQPFGGHILSHDFVEAALMRRAGYTVWLVPELDGNYEQSPPHLLAYAQRDWRWCQGNLQHLRLVLAGGLHPMSRAHFLMGVMSYVASPLWLLFLLAGLGAALHGHVVDLEASMLDSEGALWLMGVSLAMLLLPKALGLVLVLARREAAERMGGRTRLVLSALAESGVSTLLAPVMMLFQSHFVFGTLLGYRVSWTSQQRDDEELPWAEAARRHTVHTLAGVVLTAGVLVLSPGLLAWLSPVVAGLLLSIPPGVHAGPGRPPRKGEAGALGLLAVSRPTTPHADEHVEVQRPPEPLCPVRSRRPTGGSSWRTAVTSRSLSRRACSLPMGCQPPPRARGRGADHGPRPRPLGRPVTHPQAPARAGPSFPSRRSTRWRAPPFSCRSTSPCMGGGNSSKRTPPSRGTKTPSGTSERKLLQADETPPEVQAPRKTRQGFLWIFLADDEGTILSSATGSAAPRRIPDEYDTSVC